VPAERLALLRLHQRDASLSARERLAGIATGASARSDVVPLVTCHRVEIYGAIAASEDAREAFATRLGSHDLVLAEAEVLEGRAAALHLFLVAAGMDSAIVGEGQIARQLRRAYEASRGGGSHPILSSLFQRALHVARELHATTELGSVRQSIGSLAVDEALRHVGDPGRATALVVGAGEIGKLAARALARRVGRLVIANRDAARASEIAAPIGAHAVGLDALGRALESADVLISAADTRGTILTRALLTARAAHRPLVVIDIAVPRSVAEDARGLPGVLYRDVDDLGAEGSTVSAATIAAADRRCAEEADAYMRWFDERDSARTIRAVHARADAIRERQLARAMRHLGHLGERDREVVAALARGLTNALLHEPTVRLRGRPEHEPAARALFGVDDAS
jgi:glutamyl-tRNA reductase